MRFGLQPYSRKQVKQSLSLKINSEPPEQLIRVAPISSGNVHPEHEHVSVLTAMFILKNRKFKKVVMTDRIKL